MSGIFRDFLKKVRPIKFREPLAETLGAFEVENTVLEYSFVDVVKMAGHACPTVAGAYLSCKKALERLYPDEIPVRGEISVTVYGEPDEGVYGVMAQVFSYLTGAASATGFRGLGHRFRRKDLLKYNPDKIDSQAMCFEFSRVDNGKTVLVKFYPQQIPFSEEKAKRLSGLLEKVIWEADTDKSKVKRTQKIQGEWLLEEGQPQFRAEVSFEGGKIVMESDQPSNLGGGGTRPGPLHYCFFGLISCYTATFATMASQLGIELKMLTAELEGNLNFSRVFGLSQEPVMEEISITLKVVSDAPREKLEEVEKLAYERCPAIFALTEKVRLNTALEVE